MKILDFKFGGAVNVDSIQCMSGFDGTNVTHIGFVDGTEDDFAVNPQEAFKMWSDAKPSVFAIHGALIDFAHVAAIQLFADGHEDSSFKKREAVCRIWFDHGELFLPTVRYRVDPHIYLLKLIDGWKAATT